MLNITYVSRTKFLYKMTINTLHSVKTLSYNFTNHLEFKNKKTNNYIIVYNNLYTKPKIFHVLIFVICHCVLYLGFCMLPVYFARGQVFLVVHLVCLGGFN